MPARVFVAQYRACLAPPAHCPRRLGCAPRQPARYASAHAAFRGSAKASRCAPSCVRRRNQSPRQRRANRRPPRRCSRTPSPATRHPSPAPLPAVAKPATPTRASKDATRRDVSRAQRKLSEHLFYPPRRSPAASEGSTPARQADPRRARRRRQRRRQHQQPCHPRQRRDRTTPWARYPAAHAN